MPGFRGAADDRFWTMRFSLLFLAGILADLLSVASPSTAQAPPAPAVWTIPGIANVAGQNGTHFVSDLAVTNPGTAPAGVFVGFLPPGAYGAVPVFLNPGQTMVWRNVLQQLWGASASGALTVTSDGTPLLIRARTYNDAASGTYGVALPVFTDDRFLLSGEAAHSLWVSQSADASKGYRTNVAVLFPDPGGGTATVTVYDGNGARIGQSDFTLAAAGVQQIGVGKFSSSADVARATIEVKGGRAAAYSAVVDNVTGDSSLFTFDDLPAGPQDVLISGVARANGKNGTFFRTDGRLFNPGSADVKVSAAFHANQSANPMPATGSFTVGAGKVLDVTDVLGALNQPVGSSGALRFTADSPVGILCRTSNVDPTGAKPGTFGAQQKPVPILSFLSSADAGALITGVRQNAAYRTNIALAAGADGVTAQFTLKGADGSVAGSATQTLGAWGWQQTAADKLFGVAIPDDASVLVQLKQGSGDVFDSSVDNSSGDSVVTPAPALPVAIPSTATIGPEGGSVRSGDGRLTLKVPAGAVASPTAFSITSSASTAPNAVGPAYTLSPASLPLGTPGLLAFAYDRTDINGSAPGWLLPVFQSGATWYTASAWTINTGTKAVVALLSPMTLPASRSGGRQPQSGILPFVWGEARQYSVDGPTVVPPGLHGVPYKVQALKPVPNQHGVWQIDSGAIDPTSVDWTVDNQVGGNDVVGTIEGQVSTPPGSSYSAPDCPPHPAGVWVGAVIGQDVGRLNVTIFPTEWTLVHDEERDVACVVGNQPLQTIEYKVKDHAEWDFLIETDNGTIVPGEKRESPTFLATWIATPTTCPIFNVCTVSATREPPGLRFNDLSGKVVDGYLAFRCDYLHIGTPQWTLDCPMSAGDFAGKRTFSYKDGKADFTDIPFGYVDFTGASESKFNTGTPGDVTSWTWSVKPRNSNCK